MHSNRIYFLVCLSLLTCFTSVFAQSVSITIDDGETARCEGEIRLTAVVDNTVSSLNTPFLYEWSVAFNRAPSDLLENVDGNPEQGTGIGDDFSSVSIFLSESGEYVFTLRINGETTVSDTTVPITVNTSTINAGVRNSVEPPPCVNNVRLINLFTYIDDEDAGGEWVSEDNTIIVDGIIDFPDVDDSGRYTYTVTSSTVGPCNGFVDSTFVDLILTDQQEQGVNLEPSLEIVCAGDPVNFSTGLNSTDYTFQWFFDNDDGVENPIPISETREFFEGSAENGTYYAEYTSIVPGSCTIRSGDGIVVNIDPPVITSLSRVEGSIPNTETITVEFDGDPNGIYEFSIDGVTPQSSNIFENVGPGSYEFTINDVSNDEGCGSDERRITLFGLPQFFTPNGDRVNDTWNLQQDSSITTNVTIFVFDRYGKLLTQVFPSGSGWDGTFGGNNLPSDDYWYSLTDESTGEVTTGHFSLIR